ncbi:hypothetical protein [Sphingobacterium sp.]|uniref:hypothetical protein n=1 Tax=Sphingobacterium sp. TaxID=341027 RepID=UPI002586CDBA|nr:hypothetical protein [Sphingobacterium sp.]WET68928.1 MAG: hypothetical protein P0Y57_24105 [Sphingobacterium sp.]
MMMGKVIDVASYGMVLLSDLDWLILENTYDVTWEKKNWEIEINKTALREGLNTSTDTSNIRMINKSIFCIKDE